MLQFIIPAMFILLALALVWIVKKAKNQRKEFDKRQGYYDDFFNNN